MNSVLCRFPVVGRFSVRLLFTLATVFTVFAQGSITFTNFPVIPAGSHWAYWNRESPPQGDWKSWNYNHDFTWSFGLAQFGYGDGDEATQTRTNSAPHPITAYFRRTFVLSSSNATSLSLRMVRDDGAVVYINGQEVVRDRMPAGEITHTTLATAAADEQENQFHEYSISAAPFRIGTNVVAVEVHQVNSQNSDLSFDLELRMGGNVGVLPFVSIHASPPEISEPLPFEPASPGHFIISRIEPDLSLPLKVEMSFGGSAAPGSDYQGFLREDVTLPAGTKAVSIPVYPRSDNLVEGTETVTAQILPWGSSRPFNLGTSHSAKIMIFDKTTQSNLPIVSIVAQNSFLSEGVASEPTSGRFIVSRTGSIASVLNVYLRTGGTATSSQDYRPVPQLIQIAPGESHTNLVVDVIDDSLVESNETFLVGIAPGPCPTLPGLRGAWTAEPTSPADFSGFGNHGYGTNVGYILGRVGNAFSLNGSNSWITIPPSDSLRVSSLTLNAWIFPREVSSQPIVEYGEADGPAGVHLWVGAGFGSAQPGALLANIRDSDGTIHPLFVQNVIPSNQWSFVAATYDQATGIGKLYLNGNEIAAQNLGIFNPGTWQTLTLGRRHPGSPDGLAASHFNGYLDEVQVYNRALSEAELDGLYAAGSNACHNPLTYTIAPGGAESLIPIHDNDGPQATVEITEPSDLSEFPPGQPIQMEIKAFNPNGNLHWIDLYSGTNLIATLDRGSNPNPNQVWIHSFTWTNASPGTHVLTARAREGLRTVAVSNPVHILVDSNARPAVTVEFFPYGGQGPTPYADYAPGYFRFQRNGDGTQPLTVFFDVAGTAISGIDYVSISNQVVFPAGTFYNYLNLQAIDDQLDETNETIVVTLTNPPPSGATNYTIGNARQATARIYDNEGTNAAPHLEIVTPRNFELFETGSNIEFNVIARDPNGYMPRVDVSHGNTLLGRSQIAFLTPPAPGTPIHHSIVFSNAPARPYDGIRLVGYNHLGVAVTTNRVSIAVGRNADRVTLGLSSFDRLAAEHSLAGVPNSANFYIHRVFGPTNQPVQYFLAISGTTTNGFDYQPVGYSGIIPADVGYTNITILPIRDQLQEGTETILITLLDPRCWETNSTTNPTNIGCYMVGTNSHVEIVIEDGAPTNVTMLSVSVPDSLAAEPRPGSTNDTARFRVQRVSGATDSPVTFLFTLSGTALNGTDYQEINSTRMTIPANESSVDIVIVPLFDNRFETNETVLFTLVDPDCTGTNIALSNSPISPLVSCYDVSGGNVRSATIFDNGSATNHPPVVTIALPSNGAVFDQGEPIGVRVEASDPDGNLNVVSLHMDNRHAAGTNGLVLSFWTNALPGQHTFIGYAQDPYGARATSAPVHILVRGTNETGFVERELPDAYTPGNPFLVRLVARPPVGNHVWGVEDEPPRGWTVSAISNDGVFDPATGKVKFGHFTDTRSRFLTYQVTPPPGASGVYEFNGTGSVDGVNTRVRGDRTISGGASEHHPADRNLNNQITLAELTGFGAAWKQGTTWSNAPSPIPANYVSQAALIWRQGEDYHFLRTNPAPQCWVPDAILQRAFAAASSSAAQREIGLASATGSRLVTIDVQPGAGISAYNVEERVPSGWLVIDLSNDGIFDSEMGMVRWGPFLDNDARSLSYRLVPPNYLAAAAQLLGEAAFDGETVTLTGATLVTTGTAAAQLRFLSTEHRADGTVILRLSGAAGQVCTIESSADLVEWTPLADVFLSQGELDYIDQAQNSQRYYRLNVQ